MNRAVIDRVKRKAQEHVESRGRQLVGNWLDVHEEGTRGASGKNLNMFGKPRSAKGDPLAMETGAYRGAIAMQVFADGSVGVGFDNAEVAAYGVRAELDPEYGHPTLRPAVERLKSEV